MEKDEIINIIKDFLKVAVDSTKDVSVEVVVPKTGTQTIYFGAEVNNPHFFTHKEGEAINALNHIAKRIIENKKNTSSLNTEAKNFDILIDINGFQKKKIDNIHAVVHMMAERARYFKSNIEIDPMSSFERRIVHEYLSDATDLKTESEGEGPHRRVVIRYIGNL